MYKTAVIIQIHLFGHENVQFVMFFYLNSSLYQDFHKYVSYTYPNQILNSEVLGRIDWNKYIILFSLHLCMAKTCQL